jgi:hypothetical protein
MKNYDFRNYRYKGEMKIRRYCNLKSRKNISMQAPIASQSFFCLNVIFP